MASSGPNHPRDMAFDLTQDEGDPSGGFACPNDYKH